MSRGRSVVLALVIVLLGGISGFFAARLASQRQSQSALVVSEPTSPAAIAAFAKSQAATADDPSAHKIPALVPDITLADVHGLKHPIREWRGRPLVINFWATWCAPCRREIPLLRKLRRERSGERLEIVGIAVDFRDAVQKYALEMSIDYPVLVGEQDGLDAIAAFGMDTVFPFTVFADSQGRIVTLKVGELHADEARLILDQVLGIDRGTIELAAARKTIGDGVAALVAARARAEAAPLTTDPGQSKPEVP